MPYGFILPTFFSTKMSKISDLLSFFTDFTFPLKYGSKVLLTHENFLQKEIFHAQKLQSQGLKTDKISSKFHLFEKGFIGHILLLVSK